MKRLFKVIVVDDEKLIAKNIARQVEQESKSFQVVAVAHDGQTAYDLIAKHMPHVVFTDIKMPEMTGLQLAEKLQANFPSVYIVVISGHNDFELARTALRHGVKDYLLKPCNHCELNAVLRNLEQQLIATQNDLLPLQVNSTEQIVDNVKTYLQSHYASQIDFVQIATLHNVTQPYLSKIFRIHTDISPSKYLMNLRIDMAKNLLQNTNIPVRDVGAAVGYPDPFHFSKNFKAVAGCSPAQFRKEV